ncbi:MAG: hypothetical protein A3C07_03100 [Candidatus Sungbacteria bacterium RIFCSPHIGHO2_02_FULL_47_11]|uniref:Plasmid stabilization protein n=1 Tax=Candidatus Sungbacteria bacterium RIFCSPHIGHO2_02_FULL_47_11 TaxID=1802270 RepID=A0A1G2KKE6_9BACT|nr:MAG: hypothetical protein A3C07_03100 [Candidatus Sungbacteria bacterium RIFCSPHIGHO2_02_FULL_47_11]
MNWALIIDEDVRKYLKRIPKDDAKRIFDAIQGIPLNPYGGDIQKMEGEKDSWRRRVGAYRIKYEVRVKERIIYVFDFERRTSSTY